VKIVATTESVVPMPNNRPEEKISEKIKVEGNSVIVLTFNASPGMGKTYFVDYLQKNIDKDTHVQVVKSDTIQAKAFSAELFDESVSNIFEARKKLYNKNFKSNVSDMCKNLKPGCNLLIIDKCNNGPKM